MISCLYKNNHKLYVSCTNHNGLFNKKFITTTPQDTLPASLIHLLLTTGYTCSLPLLANYKSHTHTHTQCTKYLVSSWSRSR